MIDVDNPPLVLLGIIIGVFIVPFIYSFYVDDYDKGKPAVKD